MDIKTCDEAKSVGVRICVSFPAYAHKFEHEKAQARGVRENESGRAITPGLSSFQTPAPHLGHVASYVACGHEQAIACCLPQAHSIQTTAGRGEGVRDGVGMVRVG